MATGSPSSNEPVQQVIAVPEIAALLAQAEHADDPLYERLAPTARWTRDPVFLIDVPLAVDGDVQQISIETVDEHGQRVTETRKGKVVSRRAPHPDFVRHGKKIVPRMTAEQQGIIDQTSPVMCDLTTVVQYHSGVVQQVHLDILHAVLHLLHDRYVRMGSNNPRITTTYWDIAAVLDRPLNGPLTRDINDAGATLMGLHVYKYYGWQRSDETVEPAGEERWGSIVSYFKPNAGPAERRANERGPRRQTVVFEVHAALMRAVCGHGTDRVFLTRPLNLTKNLGYRIRWKKHLHRILESRFDASGAMYMPLAELWISCFGNPAEDISIPKQLYYVRHDLKVFLEELCEVGFLATGEITIGRDESVLLTSSISVNKTSKKVGFENGSEAVACQDWLRATPGPTYWAQRKPSKRDFAHDILGAVLSDSQVTRVLQQTDSRTVIEVGYGRLKTMLSVFEDRVSRLPIDAWFSASYPREPEELTIRRLIIDRTRPQGRDGSVSGLYWQRTDLAGRWLRHKLEDDTTSLIAGFLAQASRGESPGDAGGTESDEKPTVHRIYRYMGIALRVLTKALSLDPLLAKPEVWGASDAPVEVASDRMHAQFMTYAPTLVDAAVRAVGLVGWYGHMTQYCDTTIGTTIKPALWSAVRARHGEIGVMLTEMLEASRPEWEKALGYRLQRRAVEAFLEVERIQHFNQRIELGKPDASRTRSN